MDKPVAVVIANWNGLQHLRTCIPAVIAQDYPDVQIVVVDNGSVDGSVAWLRSTFPQVGLICNSENLGFAAANNQAIGATDGAYVATLNNDVLPGPGWLMAMVDAMNEDEKIGMVASQIRFAHSPGLLDSAGIEVDKLGIAWNRHLGRPADQEPTDAVEVFGPCAAAALYRREMLNEVGLFAEEYFAYYEDVELAWRARRAGWRCLYAPTAQVLHVHSATGRQGSAFKTYHLNRNRLWTFIRHYPPRLFLIWWPLILFYDTASWVFPLLKGHSEALRGHIDAFKRWRQLWGERRRYSRWSYAVPLSNPRLQMRRVLAGSFAKAGG